MTAEFKIDKGILLPKARSKYPFQEMEVGDSFKVPETMLQRARGAAYQYARRSKTKFTCRANQGKIRIWRIK